MTIVSINVWDLPYLTKDRDQRIESFLAQLSELTPDILCIQEAWESSVRTFLAGALAAQYQIPAICLRTRVHFLDRTGGLMTFVRKGIPILESSFMRFRDNGFLSLEDILARKGFLTVTAELFGVLVRIVNIHLHMRILGTERYHQKVRLEQVSEVVGVTAPFHDVLLAGDFNCEPGSEEYQKIVARGFKDARDTASVPIEKTTNAHYGLRYLNRFLVPRVRTVDYLFTSNESSVSVHNPRLVFQDELVSDHYGLMAEVVPRA